MNHKVIRPSLASEQVHYPIRDVMVLARRLAASGKDMIYLNIGDPNAYDFDLVDEAKEAAIKAIHSCKSGYAPSEGLPEALEAIERDATKRGMSVVGSFVGNGASEAIDLALSCLVNPGDNVLLPSPNYPLYAAILGRLGVEARYYRLNEKRGWEPDLGEIGSKIDSRTRGIVVNNPNNPTGAVYSREFLEGVISLAKTHGLLILCDEIYDAMWLEENKSICLASLDHEVSVVTFNGLSKVYLGPGIRIGWGVLSGLEENVRDYMEAIHRLLRARLSASHPFQYAIKACLEGGQHHLPELRKKLRRRRDICMEMISSIPGLSCVCPQAAFYGFAKIEGVEDDNAWVRSLAEETGVIVVPGRGFAYEEEGAGHFRFVFLADEEKLREAWKRIGDFMARRS